MWVKRSVSLSPGADVKTSGHMQASVRASDKFWETHATWRRFAPQEIQSHQLHHPIGQPFPRLQGSLLTSEPSPQNLQKVSLHAQHIPRMPRSIARVCRFPGLCTIPLPPGEWRPWEQGRGAWQPSQVFKAHPCLHLGREFSVSRWDHCREGK